MLQELGKQNPQLLAQINANQEEFLQMINEPMDEAGANMLAQMGAFEGDDEEGALPPNAVALTPEEAEAVGRLEGLGFPRNACLEAFLACDKNEGLAANYLLEHGMDED